MSQSADSLIAFKGSHEMLHGLAIKRRTPAGSAEGIAGAHPGRLSGVKVRDSNGTVAECH